nr:ATP synthase F0 subunit 8 [Eurymetra natalensis]
MPQMAPMSWTLLMLTFITTMIMINAIMYFNKDYMTKSKSIFKKKEMMKWSW